MTRLQRFFQRWIQQEADYVARIKPLACQVTKPVIPPLPLPAIRPLVAVPAARVDRVTRFQRRVLYANGLVRPVGVEDTATAKEVIR